MAALQGWDKTYCLQFVEEDFDVIHFFGDKTYPVSQSCQCLPHGPFGNLVKICADAGNALPSNESFAMVQE